MGLLTSNISKLSTEDFSKFLSDEKENLLAGRVEGLDPDLLMGTVTTRGTNSRHQDEVVIADIYTRVSRIQPGKPSLSMENQPDRAKEYALAKGWSIHCVYEDPDETGRNSDRDGLRKLLKDIKAGKISIVVVHRLDRLYRNLSSLLEFIKIIQAYNVRLVSVTENIDLDSMWGRFMIHILGAFAEAYVRQGSTNTRDAKMVRLQKGLTNASYIFGYCRGLCSDCKDPNGKGYCPLYGGPDRVESQRGEILVPHPIERHAVRLSVSIYSKGEYSALDIADYLNTHSFQLPDGKIVVFRTKGHQGKSNLETFVPGTSLPGKFDKDNIREIIRNPFYIGQVAHYPTPPLNMNDMIDNPRALSISQPSAGNKRKPEQTYQGQHEALYPAEVWMQNELIRKSKSVNSNGLSKHCRIYELTGIAKCAICHKELGLQVGLRGSSGSGGRRYYRCACMLGKTKSRSKKSRNETLDEVSVIPEGSFDEWKRVIPMHSATLRADKLEKDVDELVSKLSIPEEWYELVMAHYCGDNKMLEYKRQNTNLNSQRERCNELYQERRITKSRYLEMTDAIMREQKKLELSIQPDSRQILPMLQDFKGIWEKMTVIERRGLLDAMFAAIYVDGNSKISSLVANEPFDSLLEINEDNQP
jgi:DNA invertase Pin-like site-specific DNA recombinase